MKTRPLAVAFALAALLALALPALATVPPYDPADDPLLGLKSGFCGAGRALLGARAPVAADYSWDVLHATLHFAPNFGAQTLSGTVQFDSEAVSDGLAQVTLDFSDLMVVDAVRQDGAPVAWTHAADQIAVTLAGPLAAGTPFSLELDFHGSPGSSGFGSFTWTDHAGTPLLATLSEPEGARDWWPCKDVPDEKFTADLYYRVPSQYSAPGPGLLQSVTDNGDGTSTWHWQENYLINSYLIALTVTNYAHYTDWYVSAGGDSLPIENYVYPENYSNSVEDLSITPTAIALMDSLFGAYPFMDEKYGHMTFHWAGAMEHQTCTSMGNIVLGGGHFYDRIVVHELTHQWFGDAVTLRDWQNVWLNEGFASYGEALWFEYTDGQAGLTDWMTLTQSDPNFDGPVYNNPNLFGGTVYRKGAWVLHMLRYRLGDAVFFPALRHYFGLHLYDNASTADLQADLEGFTGEDLDGFFQQWVYGENRPVYRWGWQITGGPGAWGVNVAVRQVQTNAGLFAMPLPFRVDTSGGPIDLRLDNVAWSQGYHVDLGTAQPLDLAFDPDNWVLENSSEVAYDATAADEGPALATALVGNYPNPFNPATRIAFDLAVDGPVRLEILDIRGRRVRLLADGPRRAGHQSLLFDGLDQHGESLPSGIYLARLSAAGETSSLRMTLLK